MSNIRGSRPIFTESVAPRARYRFKWLIAIFCRRRADSLTRKYDTDFISVWNGSDFVSRALAHFSLFFFLPKLARLTPWFAYRFALLHGRGTAGRRVQFSSCRHGRRFNENTGDRISMGEKRKKRVFHQEQFHRHLPKRVPPFHCDPNELDKERTWQPRDKFLDRAAR